MNITAHMKFVSLLLLLGGCNQPGVMTTDDSSSSGSGTMDGTSSTPNTTSSTSTTGQASLDDTAGATESGGVEPTLPRSTVIMQTSGGGRVSSASFAARIRIGAPQPVGQAASPLHHAYLGPGSVQ